jgi:hypothetical protein
LGSVVAVGAVGLLLHTAAMESTGSLLSRESDDLGRGEDGIVLVSSLTALNNDADVTPHQVTAIPTTTTSSTTVASTTLAPSGHVYLGTSAELSPSVTNYELLPNQIYHMLLLPLQDIIIFPGDTLPLRLQNRDMIRRLLQSVQEVQERAQRSTPSAEAIVPFIGVTQLITTGRQIQLSGYGTTIQLSSTRMNTTFEDEEVVLTSKAKHRFQILDTRSDGPSSIVATVMILPDVLTSPNLSKYSQQDIFPRWVYRVNAPDTLARQVYEQYKSSLVWEVSASHHPLSLSDSRKCSFIICLHAGHGSEPSNSTLGTCARQQNQRQRRRWFSLSDLSHSHRDDAAGGTRSCRILLLHCIESVVYRIDPTDIAPDQRSNDTAEGLVTIPGTGKESTNRVQPMRSTAGSEVAAIQFAWSGWCSRSIFESIRVISISNSLTLHI